MTRGSSPLARGLRDVGGNGGGAAGIIPARAGFTRGTAQNRTIPADHPRSRGVYASRNLSQASDNGSSPLARGLRAPAIAPPATPRIIPARAGFTNAFSVKTASVSDHPRSRGVYRLGGADGAGPQGSSPLARGLHMIQITYPLERGIIPARAGFTPSRPLWVGRWRDHPRSRGVYNEESYLLTCDSGSSPLARGLLH